MQVSSRSSRWLFAAVCSTTLALACDDAVCPKGTQEVDGHCLQMQSTTLTAGAGVDPAASVSGGAATPQQGGQAPTATATAGTSASPSAASAGMPSTPASNSAPAMTPATPAASSPNAAGMAGGSGTAAPGGSRADPMTMGMSMAAGMSAGTAEPQSPCPGGGVPSAESCELQGQDEDCDGSVDEGCDCFGTPTENCADAGRGICAEGTRSCSGGKWSECKSLMSPRKEVCDGQPIDEDCDGNPNTGCACTDGTMQSCSTSQRGPCREGKQSCTGGKWGACESLVKAAASETKCDGMDEDCDGTADDSAPCPSGQRCYQSACKTWCTDDACAKMSSNPCRPDRCDQNTGNCIAGNAAPANTMCSPSGGGVGVCTNGSCQADNEVVCQLGGKDVTQWRYNDVDLNYSACDPSQCQTGNRGFATVGPCRTKGSKQPVVWDIFDDGQNSRGTETSTLTGSSQAVICAGSTCRKWFGNPRVKRADGTTARVTCDIFDDSGASRVSGRDQFTPWFGGKGHPANPDGRGNDTSVCTPDQCRKWVGDCKVVR